MEKPKRRKEERWGERVKVEEEGRRLARRRDIMPGVTTLSVN
jgi:hypothetical protein